MDTTVMEQVDQLHRATGDGSYGLLETLARHGQHRPVMVRVAVDVQNHTTADGRQGSDDIGVAALADVDDAGERA
jgi:hypothetical protein